MTPPAKSKGGSGVGEPSLDAVAAVQEIQGGQIDKLFDLVRVAHDTAIEGHAMAENATRAAVSAANSASTVAQSVGSLQRWIMTQTVLVALALIGGVFMLLPLLGHH